MRSGIQYHIHACGCSDPGRVRGSNEDSFLIANLSDGQQLVTNGSLRFASGHHGSLFAVADGMGGAAAGGMASTMGVQIVYNEVQGLIQARSRSNEEAIEEILIEAVGVANRRILDLGSKTPGFRGMGTTLTLALELQGRLVIAQIGDSRAYLIRNDSIWQLTQDQSLVAQKVNMGELTEEQARHHPQRNILLQALGVCPSVELVLKRVGIQPADMLLLSSDGMHAQMTQDEVYEIAVRSSSLEDACVQFIDVANARGGPDNITAILVQFLSAGHAEYSHDIDRNGSGLFNWLR